MNKKIPEIEVMSETLVGFARDKYALAKVQSEKTNKWYWIVLDKECKILWQSEEVDEKKLT